MRRWAAVDGVSGGACGAVMEVTSSLGPVGRCYGRGRKKRLSHNGQALDDKGDIIAVILAKTLIAAY